MIEFKTSSPVGQHAMLIPPANEGEMNIAFVNMGQGDCTIISTPNNKVFIVDCGSAAEGDRDAYQASFTEAQQIVKSWAAGKNVTIVLTHPDMDHINKIVFLLIMTTGKGETLKKDITRVDAIYFSQAPPPPRKKTTKPSSPIVYYKQSALIDNINEIGRPLLIEVTINAETRERKKWVYGSKCYSDPPECIPIDASGLVIAKADDSKWTISIIAGNVPKTDSGSTISNAASLCTLIKLDTQKLLLPGDATKETLNYLQTHQSAQLTNLSILALPHHGSEGSISTETLRDALDPQRLIISAGWAEHRHFLPRKEAINAWREGSRLVRDSIEIDYWVNGSEDYDTKEKIESIWKEVWKDYKVDNTDSFYCLNDPDDAKEAETPFYGVHKKGYFLHRERVEKAIHQTGLQETLYLTMS